MFEKLVGFFGKLKDGEWVVDTEKLGTPEHPEILPSASQNPTTQKNEWWDFLSKRRKIALAC